MSISTGNRQRSESDRSVRKSADRFKFLSAVCALSRQRPRFFDSWISGYLSSKEETANVNQRNNEAYLTEYIDKINNEDIDLIIGSDNFTDLVPDVAALLLNTIEKGGNILMIADLADHSTYNPSSVGIKTESDNADSVVKLFSVFLNQILTDRMPSAENLIDIGYYSKRILRGFQKNTDLQC